MSGSSNIDTACAGRRYLITNRQVVVWNLMIAWMFFVFGGGVGTLLATFLPNELMSDRWRLISILGFIMLVLVFIPIPLMAKLRPALFPPWPYSNGNQR